MKSKGTLIRTNHFLLARRISPFRTRTQAEEWKIVISKLGGDQRFSDALRKLTSLIHNSAISAKKIQDEDITSTARELYGAIRQASDDGLKQEIRSLIASDRSDTKRITLGDFDFRDYLAQKLPSVIGIMEAPEKNGRASDGDFLRNKNFLLEKGVLRKILLVMEWLRRNPAN